jgi:3,4-dihydroxy 2-butanone 4-phosphate synthase
MLGQLIQREAYADFDKGFRAPGHVPVIVAADGLLNTRRGHTELILRIAQIGGLMPLMVASEIVDRYSCHPLTKERAIAYAEARRLVFLTGAEVSGYEDVGRVDYAPLRETATAV